jgi:hypothetical protein
MDRAEKAKEIISKLLYITVATATPNGLPWNSPVFAAFDENYTFYWTSWPGTQHSQNITANPHVFLVIYDSTVPQGQGEGVYIQANALEVTDIKDIQRGSDILYARKGKPTRDAKEFLGDSPRRMYKAVPEKAWVNLDIDVKNSFIDTRKEIVL